MAVDWNAVAVALASRVQYEASCGRLSLIREDFVRPLLAEVLQSMTVGPVEVELNHPDIPGDTRIDVVLRTPRGASIRIASEVKWVRNTTAMTNRNWIVEVVGDLLRLERLTQGLSQGAERAIVLVGESELMDSRIWDRRVNAGPSLPRQNVVGELLQRRLTSGQLPATAQVVDLQNCGPPFQRLVRSAASDMITDLPSTYLVHLRGLHKTAISGIEAVVWVVARPQQRRVRFDATRAWP